MKFMRIALLDTVLLSPLINACENYFWEKIIFRKKLSPSDKNLIFDSSGRNWPPTVIRSLSSLKSHGVSQVALRYPRIFSSYFILIKESTFWWITFQHETVWFQQHAFMATSWQWTNPHLFIFTILWLLRLSTSWISENQKINGIPSADVYSSGVLPRVNSRVGNGEKNPLNFNILQVRTLGKVTVNQPVCVDNTVMWTNWFWMKIFKW